MKWGCVMMVSRWLGHERRRLVACLLLISVCAGCGGAQDPFALSGIPPLDRYCIAAQRLVTRTEIPVRLQLHDDFTAFVKSKALIDGPVIQQYNWRDASGRIVGISCKLKSADHLNRVFGPASAGPDGRCQDMNRAVFEHVAPRAADPDPAYSRVVFEPDELAGDESEPGMTGPDWLRPYTATWVDDSRTLHIRAKGFVVDFDDPRYAQAPPRFRGVHYCHFLAPQYLRELLLGMAAPGAVIGREVDTSRDYSPPVL